MVFPCLVFVVVKDAHSIPGVVPDKRASGARRSGTHNLREESLRESGYYESP